MTTPPGSVSMTNRPSGESVQLQTWASNGLGGTPVRSRRTRSREELDERCVRRAVVVAFGPVTQGSVHADLVATSGRWHGIEAGLCADRAVVQAGELVGVGGVAVTEMHHLFQMGSQRQVDAEGGEQGCGSRPRREDDDVGVARAPVRVDEAYALAGSG